MPETKGRNAMSKILVIDTVGDSREPLAQALGASGWEVVTDDNAALSGGMRPDAIILATDAARMGHTLKELEGLRQSVRVPLILVVDLDRSGWDRTFGSAEGLNVDALFDKPVNTDALVMRLAGILAARQVDAPPAADALVMMKDILERAIANEEAAEAFYRTAADAVMQPASRDVLLDLMREEAEHKRLLEEFRSGARALPEAGPADGSIVETFGTPDFSPDMSPADAFLLAANKEKLAIETYENWAKLYPPGPERELLLRMAQVERRHKVKVEDLFTNASFPEAW